MGNLQLRLRNQNKTLISERLLNIYFLPISKGNLIKTFPFKYFSVKFHHDYNVKWNILLKQTSIFQV